MGKITSLFNLIVGITSVDSFIPRSSPLARAVSSSTTSCEMGLFDMFSEEARKEREAKRESEEQMALQREILEIRQDPEKMEEYEARVSVRRALRMKGDDETAEKVQMFQGDADDQ